MPLNCRTWLSIRYSIFTVQDSTDPATTSGGYRSVARISAHRRTARVVVVYRLHPIATRPPIIQRRSLRSALKEFFEPLRENDSRTNPPAVHHKESNKPNWDYTREYGGLSTSLIFVSSCSHHLPRQPYPRVLLYVY